MLSSVPGWKPFTIWYRNKYFKKVGNLKKYVLLALSLFLFTIMFLWLYKILHLNLAGQPYSHLKKWLTVTAVEISWSLAVLCC